MHVVGVILVRVKNDKVLPFDGEEPRSILALNRVIGNTIEQSVIFCSLLFAALVLNPLQWKDHQFVHLVRAFIFSRVLYSVGYNLGVLFNVPKLRNLGLPGTMTCHLILLLAFAGVNMFKIIGPILKFGK